MVGSVLAQPNTDNDDLNYILLHDELQELMNRPARDVPLTRWVDEPLTSSLMGFQYCSSALHQSGTRTECKAAVDDALRRVQEEEEREMQLCPRPKRLPGRTTLHSIAFLSR